MLAEWGQARLSGHPLREPEWRRLAGHVHAGRRGERLLRRLLRARTTRDVCDILQRISERRGGRSASPVVHAMHAERRADPWDGSGDEHNYYADNDRDDSVLDDHDGWPTPTRSPALMAALELLGEIGVERHGRSIPRLARLDWGRARGVGVAARSRDRSAGKPLDPGDAHLRRLDRRA